MGSRFLLFEVKMKDLIVLNLSIGIYATNRPYSRVEIPGLESSIQVTTYQTLSVIMLLLILYPFMRFHSFLRIFLMEFPPKPSEQIREPLGSHLSQVSSKMQLLRADLS